MRRRRSRGRRPARRGSCVSASAQDQRLQCRRLARPRAAHDGDIPAAPAESSTRTSRRCSNGHHEPHRHRQRDACPTPCTLAERGRSVSGGDHTCVRAAAALEPIQGRCRPRFGDAVSSVWLGRSSRGPSARGEPRGVRGVAVRVGAPVGPGDERGLKSQRTHLPRSSGRPHPVRLAGGRHRVLRAPLELAGRRSSGRSDRTDATQSAQPPSSSR